LIFYNLFSEESVGGIGLVKNSHSGLFSSVHLPYFHFDNNSPMADRPNLQTGILKKQILCEKFAFSTSFTRSLINDQDVTPNLLLISQVGRSCVIEGLKYFRRLLLYHVNLIHLLAENSDKDSYGQI
jgi:hypothetical protein